jgi:hypothetical protein
MAAKKKAKARKKAGSRTSQATLNRALKRLGPPTTPRVFLPAVQRVGKKVDALLRRRAKTAEIDKALGRLGTLAPPPMHTMGGHFAFGDEFVGVGIRDLFDGIYVPGNDASWWIRPDHHYVHDQGWSGYADKMTGLLGAQASAHDPTHPLTTSAGGVYSQVFTTPSKYGQVSQGTFDVDLTWEASGRFLLGFPYANSVYGTLRLIGRIWLAVYEFNVATSKFEEVVAVPRIVFNEWFDTAGEYIFPYAGSIGPGQFTAKYILHPARTYWMGVIAQVEASQHLNFHEPDKPVPLPPPYQFACYARLIVNVPAMYINHRVLA